jgi:hypothetical protein
LFALIDNNSHNDIKITLFTFACQDFYQTPVLVASKEKPSDYYLKAQGRAIDLPQHRAYNLLKLVMRRFGGIVD